MVYVMGMHALNDKIQWYIYTPTPLHSHTSTPPNTLPIYSVPCSLLYTWRYGNEVRRLGKFQEHGLDPVLGGGGGGRGGRRCINDSSLHTDSILSTSV